MPFFPISDEKITALMSIFCQKRLFSKNKTSTLLKTKCSRVIFSFFFYKNPILLCPYLVKKRIFCQNYTILWAIKVNKMPFFPRFFTKKSLLSYPIYISPHYHSGGHRQDRVLFLGNVWHYPHISQNQKRFYVYTRKPNVSWI